jgi:hypothetical protein
VSEFGLHLGYVLQPNPGWMPFIDTSLERLTDVHDVEIIKMKFFTQNVPD